MKIINIIYRSILFLKVMLLNNISNQLSYFLLKINLVEVGIGFASKGIPLLYKHKDGKFIIEDFFRINNTVLSNPIGRTSKCVFRINKNARLFIGNNVGMSGTTIVCHKEIIISDNVMIGGNTCIYDTNFHSLDKENRKIRDKDKKDTKRKKVFIGKNVFIGAHVTILKGVNIGKNSIVGACSVVSKDIPENEIWAGNPAKFIRKVNEN